MQRKVRGKRQAYRTREDSKLFREGQLLQHSEDLWVREDEEEHVADSRPLLFEHLTLK